jgi:hypothetical protein
MSKVKKNIIQLIKSKNPKALFADGLNEAIIGMTDSMFPVPIYDKDKCVEVMMKNENWDYETALEFLEYNTFCAYVGEQTPLFVEMPMVDI